MNEENDGFKERIARAGKAAADLQSQNDNLKRQVCILEHVRDDHRYDHRQLLDLYDIEQQQKKESTAKLKNATREISLLKSSIQDKNETIQNLMRQITNPMHDGLLAPADVGYVQVEYRDVQNNGLMPHFAIISAALLIVVIFQCVVGYRMFRGRRVRRIQQRWKSYFDQNLERNATDAVDFDYASKLGKESTIQKVKEEHTAVRPRIMSSLATVSVDAQVRGSDASAVSRYELQGDVDIETHDIFNLRNSFVED